MSPFGSTEEQESLIASNVRRVAPARRSTDAEQLSRNVACGFILAVLSIVFLVALFEFSFVVPPGEVGIVVTLGQVNSFTSGLHFRFPFVSRLELLSAKIQILEKNNIVPTKEGLAVALDTAVLFRLNTTLVSQLYRQIGSNYAQVLIEPEAASAVRGLTSESEAKALYSSGRNMIQDTIREELIEKLGPRGIIIEDVLLKDIKLPDELTKSIEAKVQAEQDAARMQFVLMKEKQEAQRKAIEAQGVADFQRIVSEGISPELLRWKGIEATEKFSESKNSKIVIVGNSDNGLPVIFSAAGENAA
mmetsp:Transcript_17318/g.31228  ORF Transcript_17318/g.31228 Transcript_17318/m.31228 type:complete len:304 (+) Transcript_17318:729-1640(+)